MTNTITHAITAAFECIINVKDYITVTLLYTVVMAVLSIVTPIMRTRFLFLNRGIVPGARVFRILKSMGIKPLYKGNRFRWRSGDISYDMTIVNLNTISLKGFVDVPSAMGLTEDLCNDAFSNHACEWETADARMEDNGEMCHICFKSDFKFRSRHAFKKHLS